MLRFIGMALAALAGALDCSARAEILIGAAGPLTGQLSWIGEQMQRGAEMAVTDINSAGGLLGEQVQLITADDFCDPDQAVVAAQKLVDDHVVFVVGHYCSGSSIPASEIYEKAGILQISPGSTNPMLTDAGRANVFRVIGRDDAQGTVAGNYLADHWADKKIAILHDGTTYGKGLADETRKQLKVRGIIEAIYQAYTPGKGDYSAEIDTLRAANITIVYVGGYHTEVALMASASSEQGQTMQFISGDALSTEEFGLIAGQAGDGTLFTFTEDARENSEAAQVVQRFRAENFEPSGYTLLSYAAVQVWAQAVEKAKSLDLDAVVASLHGDDFKTVLGPLGFDQKGDLKVQNWVWYVWRGGEYGPLKQ
jgi:branched-chain amino acid transport system substrate-binding protein